MGEMLFEEEFADDEMERVDNDDDRGKYIHPFLRAFINKFGLQEK